MDRREGGDLKTVLHGLFNLQPVTWILGLHKGETCIRKCTGMLNTSYYIFGGIDKRTPTQIAIGTKSINLDINSLRIVVM